MNLLQSILGERFPASATWSVKKSVIGQLRIPQADGEDSVELIILHSLSSMTLIEMTLKQNTRRIFLDMILTHVVFGE